MTPRGPSLATEPTIVLTIGEASVLKGAAQLGLDYMRRRHGGDPAKSLPALEGAIETVRRGLAASLVAARYERCG